MNNGEFAIGILLGLLLSFYAMLFIVAEPGSFASYFCPVAFVLVLLVAYLVEPLFKRSKASDLPQSK